MSVIIIFDSRFSIFDWWISFGAERFHGVYLAGAAGGNESGDSGRGGEGNGRTGITSGIVRADPEQRRAEKARNKKRADDSSYDADCDGAHSLAEDHAQNCDARSAERHS